MERTRFRGGVRVYCVGVALAAAAGTGSSAGAAIVTTGFGQGADNFVQAGVPTTNQTPTAADVTVKWGGSTGAPGATDRKAYFRFDLSEITDPVTAAAMALTVSINNGGTTNTSTQGFTFNVYGLNDGSTTGGGRLGEDWGENTITWNNAPANLTTSGNQMSVGTGTVDGGQAVLLGTFAVSAANGPGSQMIAVSGQPLIDFLAADTNDLVTLMVTRTGLTTNNGTPATSNGNANSAFASAESTAFPSGAPALFVNQPVPEPGTVGVLAAAVGAGLTRRRRRRA
ncbi:MAG TPA: DNRLRE domain-containing protein [Tepidisphaeraceae bacterium]|nr:DNRLRE domain-containing protein [Tepidisphaeraceae bacterium]